MYSAKSEKVKTKLCEKSKSFKLYVWSFQTKKSLLPNRLNKWYSLSDRQIERNLDKLQSEYSKYKLPSKPDEDKDLGKHTYRTIN